MTLKGIYVLCGFAGSRFNTNGIRQFWDHEKVSVFSSWTGVVRLESKVIPYFSFLGYVEFSVLN